MTTLYLPARPGWISRQREALEEMRGTASGLVWRNLRYDAQASAYLAATGALTLSIHLLFGA
ncbi:hypothetical protein [uncultured Cohaesibacter sp.]|uniref:hypothetical protein n=1 Tax=uncultured Cohaesibacter sp. TaxID=1002546 RepID=UPI0029C9A175|nr:hypothetical protein [uncultured Cohaesibacter sp.]